ncbi:hypothetical protein ACJZL1_02775 [Wolbachia endosymbiont of Rhagoletis indifferens]|uniref:hypothetical protein n=1 Tax=Wolbachia endosymbiont of Rhagoletis indifferens TaxID=3383250 RepID=UPI003AF35AFE
MPNTRETVRALVSAFNVHNYARDTVKTNFTLQSEGKKDYIVVSFDKGMKDYQCSRYLDSIKRKIIREFYGIEESNDKEILDTAKKDFDVTSFPFNYIYKGDWSVDKQGRIEFVTPIDQGVIFNLKSHLAASLAKGVLEDMRVSSTAVPFNKKKYLWCGEFDNKQLREEFEREFLSRMENRYGYRNGFKNPLKVKGNSVYIRDVFDDARFIDSVTRYIAWLVGIDLGVSNDVDHSVMLLKDSIINSFYQSTKTIVAGFMCVSPLNREEASILIPIMQDCRGARFLTKEEARDINHAFNNVVLDDVSDKTQATFKVNGSSAIYGIDFSNKEISHCVVTKIIESSVINKDHELAIDPERALSPAQSPFNSPTHAEPPRTPPNQRKADTDSGYDSNSPPKPKDSGSSSGGPGPSTELSDMEWESPTRSQDGALEDSPRRGSEQGSETEKEGRLLHNHVNSAGTSKGSWSSTQLSFPTVSQGVPGPSKGGNLGAAAASGSIPGSSLWSQSGASSSKGANPVGTNPWAQQTNPCLSQGTSENKWISSMQFTKPGPSGLSWSQSGASSSKDANKGMSTWTSQPMNHWSSPASSAGLWSLSQSGASSSRGAGKNMLTGSSSWCLPPSTSSLTTRNDPISSNLGIFADPPEDTENICSMKEKQQVTKEKEEEKLSKALLYTFNLMNYTLDGVYTNFFAKDGKIVSLLHDNVDREEYLQVVIDYVVEEYYETEKEARESCDFDEFPFKFLPDPDYEKNQNDCEKNSRKTVVANISSGALSNLEKLFRQKFGKNVGAIDINWVKKVEKREKDEWVDRQRSYGDSLEEACKGCFPDEGPMKIIPIALEGDEYVLDRSREECEVKLLLREQKLRLRGTLVNEEEKELFKALLYAFNYSNNNFDLPDTNFIVKNGKIASLIPDSVNVEEYLQEVIDKTKEEYCEDKKEAYDLDEFPFELNCEKNQETTVVANISRGALFNLKKLFIYGYKKKAETGDIDIKIGDIDINTVEEAVKSKKDELVNSKVKGIEREGGYYSRIKPDEAATASYPDGNALEGIPIIKGKGGYCLDRTFNDWETKLFVEDSEYTKGTSKAKKMKSEDNKDSGISSGEATDAENVSSKAEGKTSGTSGYESMDCENTRGGSPKHTLELSVENLRISTKLDATKAEQHSPIKKFRSN